LIKFYFSADNIHRISVPRSCLSFDQLQERVANHLVQRKNTLAECQAYAMAYDDDEGDRVAICSQEELDEALRVHEEQIWPSNPDTPALLRFFVKPIGSAPALNNGYILV